MNHIYLDNAATACLSQRALAAMLPFLQGEQGNPSSLHHYAREARKALERSRNQIAFCIGAKEEEIVFTSGGSEGNNYLLRGAIRAQQDRGHHVIASPMEHPSVLNTLFELRNRGQIGLTLLPADEYGLISLDSVMAAIQPDTVLVSVMTANNEVGTVEPVSQIGAMCRERGILFHTDAVQAAGHMPLDVKEMNVDMLTLSAHKFHGPRGMGAVYVRKGITLMPFITGGEQEKHRRAGTENVAGAVGMAEALCEQVEDLSSVSQKLKAMQKRLTEGILSTVPECRLTGHPVNRLPGIVSFLFDGVSADELLALLDMNGVAASAGSACTAGSNELSHVLKAMGVLDGHRRAPLRLSLSRNTTEEDIDTVLRLLPDVIARLRS